VSGPRPCTACTIAITFGWRAVLAIPIPRRRRSLAPMLFCALLLLVGPQQPTSGPPPTAPVSVFARGEANSSAYRIPGLLEFRGVVMAFAVQRTLGCSDHKSGVHNIVLKRSTDQGASFGILSTVVDTAAVRAAASFRPCSSAQNLPSSTQPG
jgi:hypothetical protein